MKYMKYMETWPYSEMQLKHFKYGTLLKDIPRCFIGHTYTRKEDAENKLAQYQEFPGVFSHITDPAGWCNGIKITVREGIWAYGYFDTPFNELGEVSP